MTQIELLEVMSDAIPEKITFYEQGALELEKPRLLPQDVDPVDCVGLVYRLITLDEGVQAVIILLIPKTLNLSMYQEVGNVIAGKLASDYRVQQHQGLKDLMISPPKTLDEHRIRKLLSSQKEQVSRLISHRHGEKTVKIQTVLLPSHGVIAHA